MGEHFVFEHVVADAFKEDWRGTHVECVVQVNARASLHIDAEQIERTMTLWPDSLLEREMLTRYLEMTFVGGYLAEATRDAQCRQPGNDARGADIWAPILDIRIQETTSKVLILDELIGHSKGADDEVSRVASMPTSSLRGVRHECWNGGTIFKGRCV